MTCLLSTLEIFIYKRGLVCVWGMLNILLVDFQKYSKSFLVHLNVLCVQGYYIYIYTSLATSLASC